MNEERLIVSAGQCLWAAGQCLWAAVHRSLIPALGRQKVKKRKIRKNTKKRKNLPAEGCTGL